MPACRNAVPRTRLPAPPEAIVIQPVSGKWHDHAVAYVRTFGEIPGNPPGTPYGDREEVRLAGLHAHNQAGISGTKHEGADAIVLNGGYPDDQDAGDVIVYTGHGGQHPRTKQQIADQNLEDTSNAALVGSQLEGLPVRVIRGHEEPSKHAPAKGYRYDGLYRIVRHWFKTRDDGLRVLQFQMVKISSTADVDPTGLEPATQPDTVESAEPAGRTPTTVNRLNRRAKVVRNVKAWHENRCQVCGIAVELPNGPASQVAHIQGLGIPHNGPDVEENALCLCPNDHLRFDNGAFYLTDDLKIVNSMTGALLGELRTHKEHRIGVQYIRQHRGCWSKE